MVYLDETIISSEWADPAGAPTRFRNVETARDLARVGFSVFPCDQKKHPLVRWREESTCNIEQVERWWANHPNALVGMDCGKADLVVIDADRHGGPDGVVAVTQLVGGNLQSLGCPVIETAGGGLHLVFRQRDGERLGNSRGSLPPGIDVRGDGGFVIAVGSTRDDGSAWRQMEGTPDLIEVFMDGPLPPLPDVFADLIVASRDKPEGDKPADALPPSFGNTAGKRERAWAAKALEGVAADLSATAEGGRNHDLNASAYRMGRMGARGWIDEATVRAALEDACMQNGLWKEDGPRGVRASFNSGWNSGTASPHEDLPEREEDQEYERIGESFVAALIRKTDGTLYDPETGEVFEEAAEAAEPGRDNANNGDAGAAHQSSQEQQPGPDPLAGFIFDGEASLEPPPMLVKKLVPRDGICFIGGQSGAGKTFIAVYLAVMLASGGTFFGHKVVERVGVAIFAAEGAGTMPSRITVARNYQAGGEILPVTWLGAVPNLADAREVMAMVRRLRAVDAHFCSTHGVRLGAVICDTLAASFSLNDENDNSEAAKAIRAMKIMSDALGVVVLPIHHFGKAAETGLRGASAWRAGCDTVLSVLAERDQTTGACSNRRIALSKSRVGEEGWVAPFDLHFVELGVDEDGAKFGACYVKPGKPEEAIILAGEKRKGPPRAAKVFLDAFGIVIGDKGRKVRPFGSDGPEVVAVDREDVRDEFYRLWAADGENDESRAAAQRKAFKRGEDWALDHRAIASYVVGRQHMVWRLKDEDQ